MMDALYTAHLAHESDVVGWMRHAATCLSRAIPPDRIRWCVAGADEDLFSYSPHRTEWPRQTEPAADIGGVSERVPGRNTDNADHAEIMSDVLPWRAALLHCDTERFARFYRFLVRSQSEPGLAQLACDPDVQTIHAMVRAVRRDIHRIRAFLRFRKIAVDESGGRRRERFVAWYTPEHHILRVAAPFFVRRYATMDWSILSPRECIHWDGASLTISPGIAAPAPGETDGLEHVWQAYYAATFNPARVNPRAMMSRMPRKYWRNLPEAEIIAPLVQAAPAQVQRMIAQSQAMSHAPCNRKRVSYRKELSPARGAALADDAGPRLELPSTLSDLNVAIRDCARCTFSECATQAICGEGSANASIFIVGEQPGDHEDLAGKPFVGPAGQLLDQALREAGIDRQACYVTNAVKHFKFAARGRRRLHRKPDPDDISRCRTWLGEELRLVSPQVVVALGASAAQALTGEVVAIRSERGRIREADGGRALVITLHPSYVLRLQERDLKAQAWEMLVADLRLARSAITSHDLGNQTR